MNVRLIMVVVNTLVGIQLGLIIALAIKVIKYCENRDFTILLVSSNGIVKSRCKLKLSSFIVTFEFGHQIFQRQFEI